MSLTRQQVERVLRAFDDPGTVFILGAGASAPDVPVMSELIGRVMGDFAERVHGVVAVGNADDLVYRFADAAADEDQRQWILAGNRETFRLLIADHLNPSEVARVQPPSQYELLESLTAGKRVLTYNVDGLLNAHCPRANAISIHGTIPQYVSRLRVEDAVRLTQEGIRLIPESAFWLPIPEEASSLLSVIDSAYRPLHLARTIVVIGYSFGRGPKGFDDQISFEALVEYCRDRQVEILVVDPCPRELCEALQECLRIRTVFAVPAWWNPLSRAVLSAVGPRPGAARLTARAWDAADIARIYDGLLG